MERRLLPVYYGWAKLNKIAKREALTVIFLNDSAGPRTGRDDLDVTENAFIIGEYKMINS